MAATTRTAPPSCFAGLDIDIEHPPQTLRPAPRSGLLGEHAMVKGQVRVD